MAAYTRITTYADLCDVYLDWIDEMIDAKGRVRHICILGRPDTGKSTLFKNLIAERGYQENEDYLLFEQDVSQPRMYKRMAQHPDLPMIWDDVSAIVSERKSITLMLGALHRQRPRRVEKDVTRAADDDTPALIHLTGNGLVILNELPDPRSGLQQALRSRVDITAFDPMNLEVFRYWAHWERDVELVKFIGSLLDLGLFPEYRLGLRLFEDFATWRESKRINFTHKFIAFMKSWLADLLSSDELDLACLLAQNPHATLAHTKVQYAEQTGRSEASAARQVSRLLKSGTVQSVAQCLINLRRADLMSSYGDAASVPFSPDTSHTVPNSSTCVVE